jgi:hypothetical protein
MHIVMARVHESRVLSEYKSTLRRNSEKSVRYEISVRTSSIDLEEQR